MDLIRFNTCKYYKACNVLFFNKLSGQNAGNFTKKLCKHLTSTKKTFNKMTPIQALLRLLKPKQMSNKQSSIEFLLTEFLLAELDIPKLKSREKFNKGAEILRQAKEMHKQEIIDAWKMGRYDSDKIVMSEKFYAEQYYTETFGK